MKVNDVNVFAKRGKKLTWTKGVHSQVGLGLLFGADAQSLTWSALAPEPRQNSRGRSRRPREDAPVALPCRCHAGTRTRLVSWHPVNTDPHLNLQRSHFFPCRVFLFSLLSIYFR